MMNRKLLIPVFAVLALLLKEIGGIHLDDSQIDIMIEGILGVTAIVGIFMNPKKSPSRPKEKDISNHHIDGGGQ
jgi:uncharacterized membrane protein